MPFVNDTFTDTATTVLSSHTGETGATWTRHASYTTDTHVISDANRCRTSGANFTLYYASGEAAGDDYDIEYTVYPYTHAANVGAGAALEINTAAETFYQVGNFGSEWKCVKFSAGVATEVGASAAALTTDESHDVKIEVRVSGGSRVFRIYHNESLVATFTDSTSVLPSTGVVGVNIYRAATDSAGHHLDSFSATDVVSLNDIAITDEDVFASPYNWRTSGTTLISNTPGAYLKTKFTGTSCTLLVDLSLNSGLSTGQYPAIIYSVDGGAYVRESLEGSGGEIELADSLTDTTHTLEIVVVGQWYQANRWTTLAGAIKVTGLRLDAEKTLAAPTIRDGRAIIFGDSNSEGYEALAVGVSVANQDASQAWPFLLGESLDCEVGVIATAGQGYIATGGGSVPSAANAWDFYSSGESRLVSDALDPSPDWLISGHGQNDSGSADATLQSTVETLIDDWLVAAPDANIVLVAPTNLTKASVIEAAVTAADSSRVKYVSTEQDYLEAGESGANRYSNNNHLSVRGHSHFASRVATLIGDAFEATAPATDVIADAVPSEINLANTGKRQIEWIVADADLSASTIQWDGQTAKAITGAITFRETVAGVHYYDWAYDEDDRPSDPGSGVVVLDDGVNDTVSVPVDFVLLNVPSAVENAEATRTELATELARIDENVSAAKELTSDYDAAKTAATQASVAALPQYGDTIQRDKTSASSSQMVETLTKVTE